MSLLAFFEAIAPFLEGRMPADEAVARLWGKEVPARSKRDAERLAIYADSYQAVGQEMLSATFPEVCAWVGGLGRTTWRELVQAYLLAHPPSEVRYVQAGLSFPDFLEEIGPERGLPPWLAELADLELWHRLSMAAPDLEPTDAGGGPLRLAANLEVRDYHHDLLGWLEASPRPEAPRPGRTLVVFWRTRRGAEACRARLGLLELAVIRMVRKGLAAPEPIAGQVPSPAEIARVWADLRQAGLIEGDQGPRPVSEGAP